MTTPHPPAPLKAFDAATIEAAAQVCDFHARHHPGEAVNHFTRGWEAGAATCADEIRALLLSSVPHSEPTAPPEGIDAAVAALRRLVFLKRLKDNIDRAGGDDRNEEYYRAHKPLAWQEAFDAVAGLEALPLAQPTAPPEGFEWLREARACLDLGTCGCCAIAADRIDAYLATLPAPPTPSGSNKDNA